MLYLVFLTEESFVGTTEQWHQEGWYYLMKIRSQIKVDCYSGANINFSGLLGWSVCFQQINVKEIEEIAEKIISNVKRITSWELWCCQERKCIKRREKR